VSQPSNVRVDFIELSPVTLEGRGGFGGVRARNVLGGPATNQCNCRIHHVRSNRERLMAERRARERLMALPTGIAQQCEAARN
jgi:hypothetical protein